MKTVTQEVLWMNAFCHVSQALRGPSEHGDQPQTFRT
jgi:hypothetical protein